MVPHPSNENWTLEGAEPRPSFMQTVGILKRNLDTSVMPKGYPKRVLESPLIQKNVPKGHLPCFRASRALLARTSACLYLDETDCTVTQTARSLGYHTVSGHLSCRNAVLKHELRAARAQLGARAQGCATGR